MRARVRLPRASLRVALVAAGLTCASATAQAPDGLRIAVVIGNAAYAGAAALVNPTNDAAAMAATLRTLGFEVQEVRDGSRAQMLEAVEKAGARLKGRLGVGVLYYAGHGFQVDFRNYMVPVDAQLKVAADAPRATVDVADVIETFKRAGTRMNIVVLDACRDNPFETARSGRGLAPLDAPPGTFLAYATAPGNVAEDGDAGSGNGLYTGFLVKELQRPSARIEDVFKRVRLQVRQKSQGRQIPWESTSLEDDFYFNDGVKYTFRADDIARIADQQRRAEFERAKAQAEEEARLKRLSAEKAREEAFRIEKADWERIKDSRNADDFYAFLQKYPSGFVSEQAQGQLERLQKAQVQAQRAPNAIAQLPPGQWRFREGDVFTYDNIDGFTKVATRGTFRITLATADRVEVNGGRYVYTQDGAILRNLFGTFSPGVLQVPNELFVGKRWKTAFENIRPDGVKETSFWSWHVTAFEEVTVPAGKYMAFKIEGRGEARRTTDMSSLEGTTWVDPATMVPVRSDRLFRSGGKIDNYFSNQLVSAQLVPRPAAGSGP